jgi:hypothetical protein
VDRATVSSTAMLGLGTPDWAGIPYIVPIELDKEEL